MDKIKVLLTGGSGVLGSEFLNLYNKDKYIFFAPSSNELDITDFNICEDFILKINPDIIIHSAAYTNVKESEKKYLKAIDTNVIGTINILKCAAYFEKKIVYISTDYVFDGETGNYSINDSINPISKYAKSKAAGELVVRMYENSLIIRTSFYGRNFPYDNACCDQYSTKDYIDVMAPKILDCALSKNKGIFHIASKKRSIYDIACERKPNVKKIYISDLNIKIPKDISLICE